MLRSFRWILIVLLLGWVFVQLTLFGPEEVSTEVTEVSHESGSQEKAKLSDDEVNQLMSGVHLVEMDKDRREWELWAETARTYKSREVWDLEKVRADFYSTDGIKFGVTGRLGKVYPLSKDLEIWGEVQVISSNGYQFDTEEVIYNSKQKTLVSKSLVKMRSVGKTANTTEESMTASRMKADLENSVIYMNGEVRATRKLRSGEKVFVTSEMAELRGREKKVRFKEKVQIEHQEMKISGPEADFLYSDRLKAIQSLVVQGGVRVSDAEKWATSDDLNVNFEKDRFVLRGRPRVVQGKDELRGEEIVFTDKGKRVQVRNARARVNEDREKQIQE